MLGDELRRARVAVGMTQQALGEATDLDRNYVSLLERNRRLPSLKVFVDICTALEVRASEVLARVERSIAKADRSGRGKQPTRRYKNS